MMNPSYLQPLEAITLSRTSSNASLKRQLNNSSGSQSTDQFDGLIEWPEQDLIQLTTPILSACQPDYSSDKYLICEEQLSGGVPTIAVQPSLLDLQDPISNYETDPQLAERLSQQRVHGKTSSEDGRRSSFSASSVVTTQKPDHLMCDQCETKGIARSYCNVCQAIFCPKCWETPIPHKRRLLAPGSVPHEKTDFSIAQKIKSALESHMTDEDQAKLHQKDEDTTWFGILREDSGFPSFQDYGRYANLMAESSRSPIFPNDQWDGVDSRYPSLVSFVGETGAGKSTVIKLVIDLQSTQEEDNATPVVGCAGQDVPTSGDVHLYPDPQTFESRMPILFADCEGLKGGEREPVAKRSRKKKRTSRFGRVGSFEKRMQRIPHTSEREITWADTNEKRSREFAVTNLYPRLLYTFSDVVVFVLKNPRVIEDVFEKLVLWAAAALEKSSNQPVLPHAIIVLNASENNVDTDLWDIDVARDKLLQSLSETVIRNHTFKQCALFWKERNRTIRTVEELLLSYYSSIRVVRIPTIGRPNLISEQIVKLYDAVRIACKFSQETRLALRMLLDADELQSYLQYAFDHFACNLDTPFDFVKASVTKSPIPPDFGGNILKLAINFMEAFPKIRDGRVVFKELSKMVASCIMLDSARHKIRGTAEQIFPQYLEHVEAALENFCDRHWPCEYVKPGVGARCVNVRSGHDTKGHQLKNGKVIAIGNYISRLSFEGYREEFENSVYLQFWELLEILNTKIYDSGELEVDAAAKIHKDIAMKHFYNLTAQAGGQAFISHSTCFCCLFEPPEHVLPCGHVLCTFCLQAYGRSKGKYVVEINGCPIESLSNSQDHIWRVAMKPVDAGIRVLTLNGGGIRGIVELEILRQIELALGGRIAVRHLFDLIVGTSTGGIIALGLGAKGWSVEYCTSRFEAFCKKAFKRRKGGGFPGLGFLVSHYNHSKYETTPLQEALMEVFGEEEVLFGGSRLSNAGGHATNVKVAVVSTLATNSPVVLTNYNRLCSEKLSYQFQRPEKLESELKIWEAARATLAAPKLFKPFHHEPSKQVYRDGAIYHNNPIEIADKERKNLWPSSQTDYPDVVVSIGTAYGPPQSNIEVGSLPPQLGVLSHGKSLYKIAIDHIASALDSEKAWNRYVTILQPPREDLSRFVRLNPQLEEDPPNLDDFECVQNIKDTITKQMTDDERIPQLALQLVASCFYFEKSATAELQPDDSYECRGHICCRFLPGSEEICELGKFLKRKLVPGRNPAFVIQEKYRGQEAKCEFIAPIIIDRMIRQQRFNIGKTTIRLSSKLAVTEIFLSTKDGELFPISKFPRSLLEDEGIREKTRKMKISTSIRWAGRTDSRRRRQQQWTPPDLSQCLQGMLSNYPDEGHPVGLPTTNAFMNDTNQWTSTYKISAEPSVSFEANPLYSFPGKAELDGTGLVEMSGSSPGSSRAPAELSADPPRTTHVLGQQAQELDSVSSGLRMFQVDEWVQSQSKANASKQK